jgi:hypothetical protein
MDSREWGESEDAAQHNAGAEHAAFHTGVERQICARKSAVRQAVGFDSGGGLRTLLAVGYRQSAFGGGLLTGE